MCMEIIGLDEMFQMVMIGSISGLIATSVNQRGTVGVMAITFVYWAILVLAIYTSIPIADYVETKLNDEEENEDRPYSDVSFAS